jgi:hypothetical protein
MSSKSVTKSKESDIAACQYPSSSQESQDAYADFLASLDCINQQEDLRGKFKGKIPDETLKQLFDDDEPGLDRFPRDDAKAAARWERQVQARTQFPITTCFLSLRQQRLPRGKEGGACTSSELVSSPPPLSHKPVQSAAQWQTRGHENRAQ